MKLPVLLFLAFLVQEPITSNAVLLQSYQNNYNVWLIHILFIGATIIDICVGYFVGTFIHKRFKNNKIVSYAHAKTESFFQFAGKNSKRIALFVYGPVIFPISAFFIPWIGMSFWEAFIFFLAGDIVFWYVPEWLLVLGVKLFVQNSQLALYVIVTLSILLTILMKYMKRRKENKKAASKDPAPGL